MKANIHPTYFPDAKVVCACGNTFTVGSTKQLIKVELCSQCHPFYTGVQKFVDRVGKIERFVAKQQTAQVKQAQVAKKKEEKAREDFRPKTLREMLMSKSE